MPLTEEEKKERRRKYDKKRYIKDKEKIKTRQKSYYLKTRKLNPIVMLTDDEKKKNIKESKKRYRLKNKEKVKIDRKIRHKKEYIPHPKKNRTEKEIAASVENRRLYRMQYRKENKAKLRLNQFEYRNSLSGQDKRERLDRRRDLYYRREFGIDLDQYNVMLDYQNDACAICGLPETYKTKGNIKNLAVDHCHTTNKIRGLLCVKCNTALGKFNDDIDILASAISYLQQ
jgi:hypothetical protein